MDELNRTAIMIVRNPFTAFISHRHLVSELSKMAKGNLTTEMVLRKEVNPFYL